MNGLATLLGTGLRGLRARLLLTCGSVLLATIAFAAAIVGPTYQVTSSASFLVSQLRTQPAPFTGLTFESQPEGRTVAEAAAQSPSEVPTLISRHFGAPEVAAVSKRLRAPGLETHGQPPLATLYAEAAPCERIIVAGICPSRPGEILMLDYDAALTQTAPGDTVRLQRVARPLTVVGTYRLPADTDGWFDASRFRSIPAQPDPRAGGFTPYYPAPFITVAASLDALDGHSWFVRLDYRLQVPASTTLAGARQAAADVTAITRATKSSRKSVGPVLQEGNALAATVAEVEARRGVASSTVTPAALSLILVALVLLVRLLSTATALRSSELALASLRGIDRRRLWMLALLEPVLIIALATPLGLAAGLGSSLALARAWLVPGLPVSLGIPALGSLGAVVVASVAVAAIAVRSAISDPLSSQIANVRRPARSARGALALKLGILGAAMVVLASALRTSSRSQPDATDVLLPILLALAAGLATTAAMTWLASRWVQRSGRRAGVVAYIASRTIARRQAGTWLILPLTAALAIAVFTIGIYSTAASWRASDAATHVGGDRAYELAMPMSEAVAVTHRLDPGGKFLMAVAADGDAKSPKVVVDIPRLARVGVWPSSWTPGLEPAEIAEEIGPVGPPLTLSGRRVSLSVDNAAAPQGDGILVSLDLMAPEGSARHIYLGPFPAGRTTASAVTQYCRTACEVSGLTISGPGTLPVVLDGEVTMSDLTVDGRPVPGFGAVGWAAAVAEEPQPVGDLRTDPDRLAVTLDSGGAAAIRLAPLDVPVEPAVLLGRGAHPEATDPDGAAMTMTSSVGENVTVRAVGRSESTPFLGPTAMMVDYTAFARASNAFFEPTLAVYVVARYDTPDDLLRRLTAAGVTRELDLDEVARSLDQDPYALALKLYLVVTVIVVLLAVVGLVATMASQLPARRRDAASLRVVGTARRSILRAAVLDVGVTLAVSAAAGIGAGALAQYVVVRSVTLNSGGDAVSPRVLPSLDMGTVGAVLVVAVALLLCVASLFGALTIRGARTATLRESG